jgi:predicted nucleic acid-binding protein
MRAAVLADTGPLYSAVDPHDAHHQRAQHQMQQLARSRREILVSFPTLLEAYSLIMFRLGGKVALRWLTQMQDAALVNPTLDDYRRASAKLNNYPDQHISFFDATVATLANRLEVEVWTYDHHFDVMRVPVWR